MALSTREEAGGHCHISGRWAPEALATLDQKVEHFAFVIDGAPQEEMVAADPHHHLVKMPVRRWRPAAAAELLSIGTAGLATSM